MVLIQRLELFWVVLQVFIEIREFHVINHDWVGSLGPHHQNKRFVSLVIVASFHNQAHVREWYPPVGKSVSAERVRPQTAAGKITVLYVSVEEAIKVPFVAVSLA